MKKNSSVEAWEKFQKENPTMFCPRILANPDHLEFLTNRLHRAFFAGHAVGEMVERERIKENLVKLTD